MHQRRVLVKNHLAYYRVIENILNISCHLKTVNVILPEIIPAEHYSVSEEETNKISFDKLNQFNLSLNLEVIDHE